MSANDGDGHHGSVDEYQYGGQQSMSEPADPDSDSTESPRITQQYAFNLDGEGEGGAIEPSEESVETSLETFGADIDHRERDSQLAKPEASTFGVDDRPSVTRSDSGEQGALFADTSEDQRTLSGERASAQCLFSNDGNASSESADGESPEVSVKERANQAVADGSQTTVRGDQGDR